MSEQQERLEAVREILRAKGWRRERIADWCQRRIGLINEGDVEYARVLREAREAAR